MTSVQIEPSSNAPRTSRMFGLCLWSVGSMFPLLGSLCGLVGQSGRPLRFGEHFREISFQREVVQGWLLLRCRFLMRARYER
jgi:hypothetical protein